MTGSAPWISTWRRGEVVPPTSEDLHTAAFSMAAARRAMRGTLPADLIHDAALDMLLHLYLGRPAPVAATVLADQTTVAPVVAGHWLAALRAEGLVASAGGMVALTDAGVVAISAMLAAVVESQREMLGWDSH